MFTSGFNISNQITCRELYHCSFSYLETSNGKIVFVSFYQCFKKLNGQQANIILSQDILRCFLQSKARAEMEEVADGRPKNRVGENIL